MHECSQQQYSQESKTGDNPNSHQLIEINNKIWSIHRTECNLAVYMNEVLRHAAAEVNPENILLCETSQTQKAAFVGLHF